MSRRTKDFKVEASGRDQGKIFRLTEMSAFATEVWAAKALLALLNAGVDIPDNVKDAGLAGLASIALSALGKMPAESLIPLMEEMMTCVQAVPDPRNPLPRPLFPDDIEEVMTLLKIRKELLELHLGFSLAAKLSSSTASAAEAETTSQTT
jgi:hypothetical protein